MLSGMKRDQREVSFFNEGLQPADAILIASDLKFMAVLTTLNLWSNSIGDEGAMAIAEALKVNAVVTTLALGNNNIGNDGAKAIAEALKVNVVLTSSWSFGRRGTVYWEMQGNERFKTRWRSRAGVDLSCICKLCENCGNLRNGALSQNAARASPPGVQEGGSFL
jgi:hypothetical protein